MNGRVTFASAFAALIILGMIMIVNISDPKIVDNLDEKPEIRIALITKMKHGEYWQTLNMGAEVAAQELGIQVDYMGPDEESNYKAQSEMIINASKGTYDAIVLAPSDMHLLDPALEYAASQNVPVILVDSQVNSDYYYRSFTTDNYKSGRELGAMAIKLGGEDIKVGIINFVSGSANAIERERGVREYLEEYPNVVIRDTMYSMSDVELASQITDFMLHELRPPDVIIGLNAVSTLGIAKEMDQYPRHQQVPVIGFDSTPQEVEYLESSVIDKTIVQNPLSMGYLGVVEAKRAIDGIQLGIAEEKDVTVNTVTIDFNNMYDPENEKLIFPFLY